MAAREKQPSQKRLAEDQINTFGEIFPGFDVWYRENHDADGRYIGEKLPGLKPPEPEGNDGKESETCNE